MSNLLIPTGVNADFYMTGRLVAMRGTRPAVVEPPRGTPAWWANEGTKDWWAGIPSRTGIEVQGTGGAPAPNPPQSGNPPPGPRGINWGTPIPVGPPGPGAVWVPPPGVPVGAMTTYEIFGRANGRLVPYTQVVQFRNGQYAVRSGDSLLVGNEPQDGYGYGGQPGRWAEVAAGHSPSDFGLDANRGVVAFNGTAAHPVPAYELLQLFGANWRGQVYR